MKQYKNFFGSEEEQLYFSNDDDIKKDEEGYIHASMTTYIFNEVNKNLLATNSMYASLLKDVIHSIEPYPTKENIKLDIYETHNIDDLSVQTVTFGFKKYVFSCLKGAIKHQRKKFLLFFSFFLVGLSLEIILYVLLNGLIPMWLFKSFEVIANLFIWQFGGHIAFDFFPETKKIRRYKQILRTKIDVKHWD